MNAIAITDRLWAIGRDGGRLFPLDRDLERLDTLTRGGTVILSHQFLKCLPDGQPMPQRRNIIITKDKERALEGFETAPDPEAALELAGGVGTGNLWIVGSGSLYAALMARCHRAYITKVEARVADADTFFPNLDKLPGWEVERTSEDMEEAGVSYRFIDYVNNRF